MFPGRFRSFRDAWTASTLEVFGLFLLLFLYGGYPVPDVNETYYVGKAVHFWEQDGIKGDVFLDSGDAHWFFYATFGLLSLIFDLPALAWSGRIVAWFFFAFAWRRLSHALIPIRFISLVTLAGLLCYVEAFHMSGEWIAGGIEGKCLAYPFMFLGLEAFFKGQWRRIWIFLGLASAFHVLVGGWAVGIVAVLWLCEVLVSLFHFRSKHEKKRPAKPPVLAMLPFVFLGGVLALPGLVPAILLDYGTDPGVVSEAHRIYVFERLAHHLLPSGFPVLFQLRFAALSVLGAVLYVLAEMRLRADVAETDDVDTSCHVFSRTRFRRLGGFVFGSLVLAAIGFAIFYSCGENVTKTAGLMRFYWFRMSDVAVPMGVSFLSCFLFINIVTHRAGEPDSPPSFSRDALRSSGRTCLRLLLVGFGMYFALTWLLFYGLFELWSPIPDSPLQVRRFATAEPGISWAATLLLSTGVLAICKLFQKIAAASPSLRRFRDTFIDRDIFRCAWILLFGSITLWQPGLRTIELLRTRACFSFSRSDPAHLQQAYCWIEACRWIDDPANGIAAQARFLTPQDSSTFKWHARRAEVATWKDIPQDAGGIVRWYEAFDDIYQPKSKQGFVRRDIPLALILNYTPPRRYEHLRKNYRFDYIVCGKEERLFDRRPGENRIELPLLYENLYFRIYRAEPKKRDGHAETD